MAGPPMTSGRMGHLAPAPSMLRPNFAEPGRQIHVGDDLESGQRDASLDDIESFVIEQRTPGGLLPDHRRVRACGSDPNALPAMRKRATSNGALPRLRTTAPDRLYLRWDAQMSAADATRPAA